MTSSSSRVFFDSIEALDNVICFVFYNFSSSLGFVLGFLLEKLFLLPTLIVLMYSLECFKCQRSGIIKCRWHQRIGRKQLLSRSGGHLSSCEPNLRIELLPRQRLVLLEGSRRRMVIQLRNNQEINVKVEKQVDVEIRKEQGDSPLEVESKDELSSKEDKDKDLKEGDLFLMFNIRNTKSKLKY